VIKRIFLTFAFLLIFSKILACSLGYILYGKLANYSINFIINTWHNLYQLNIFTQLMIYLCYIIYSLIIYKSLYFIFKRNIRKVVIDDLHGSARFLTYHELQNTNLLNNKQGVFIGGIQDKKGNTHYLRSNGSEHCLILAPTRAGKGVCLVIPTILTWGTCLHSV